MRNLKGEEAGTGVEMAWNSLTLGSAFLVCGGRGWVHPVALHEWMERRKETEKEEEEEREAKDS